MTHSNDPFYGLPSMMQIRHDRVIGFHAFTHSKRHLLYLKNKLSSSSFRSKAYSGRLSPGARKRLSKACQIMACVTPNRRLPHPTNVGMFNFRLAFVTLTFPKALSPEQEKNCPSVYLKPFIQHLIRFHGVKNYVWRAELTKNDRLHFHIIIDQPIHWQQLRNSWNRLLRLNGQLTAYAKENGHYNANSTDIRKIHSLQKALKYTSKYISKSGGKGRALFCKVWDASEFLKVANWSQLEVGQESWYAILKDLTGYEDGVLLAERFFVVAHRYLKAVPSLKAFLLKEIGDWVLKMRIACGWELASFSAALVPECAPVPIPVQPRVNRFELHQLALLFPI